MPMTPEIYAQAGGVHCPNCGGTKLKEAYAFEAHESRAILPMYCDDCDSQWDAVYALNGYQFLNDENQGKEIDNGNS